MVFMLLVWLDGCVHVSDDIRNNENEIYFSWQYRVPYLVTCVTCTYFFCSNYVSGDCCLQGDWWYARNRNKTNGPEGYIPSNYIAKVKSLESEP